MKRFLKEDIQRSLQIMGLSMHVSDVLVEALSLAAAGNPIVQFADVLKGALKKGTIEVLTEEEQYAMKAFAREIKYLDNTLDLGEIGEKLTKEQITMMRKIFSPEFTGGSLKYYVAAAANQFATLQKTLPLINQETLIKQSLIDLGTEIEDINKFLRQMDESITLADREETNAIMKSVADQLDETNPYKKIITNVIDDSEDKMLRQMEYGYHHSVSEEEISRVTDDILGAIEEGAEAGEKNIEEIIINPRILDDVDEEIGGDMVVELENRAKKVFIEDMRKNCTTPFCRTMVSYYDGKSKRFDEMWSIIVKDLEGQTTKITNDGFSNSKYTIPKDLQETYNAVLTTWKKYNRVMTPDEYTKFGERIYKKWSELGMLSKFSLQGLFGNTTNGMYVIGRTMIGTDIYTGKFSFAAMRKRWFWFNLMFLVYNAGEAVYEITLGSDDPNQDTYQLMKEKAASVFKNVVYTGLGLAPAYRITLEALIQGFEMALPESRYVNKEELLKFLKEQSKTDHPPGWTDIEVYDNIFNKKGVSVYFGVDDEPEFTQIKGITDPLYSSANGRYQYVKSGDFVYKLTFIPEGQKKPKETELVKSLKVDKDIIQNIENLIATNSALSPIIKDRLTGVIKKHKKHLDYKEQKIMTDSNGKQESVLIFEFKNANNDESSKFAFNYTRFKEQGSPDLKNADNWNNLVRTVE